MASTISLTDRCVVIVAHTTRVDGPPQALRHYCLERGATVIMVDHPLDYDPTRRSTISFWRNGKMVWCKDYSNWLSLAAVNYFKDFILTVWLLLRYGRSSKIDYAVGADGLSSLAIQLVRPFVPIKQLISYNVDYATDRFPSKVMNAIYHWVDRTVTKRADWVWCITNRIAEIRYRQGKAKARVCLVPNGLFLDRIQTAGPHDQGLVFSGNLTPAKGVDRLITAVAELTGTQLTIFGDGGMLEQLKQLTKDLKLEDRIDFAGRVSNQSILEQLNQFTVGLALYRPNENYVYYSDPLKVKEYLAAGLPVIMSDIPELAQTVKEAKVGVAIDNPTQLAEALKTIEADYEAMQQRALDLAKDFDWRTIFDSVMTTMTEANK
jgi:glycosyltransferase involved in cell wall biosynthesis